VFRFEPTNQKSAFISVTRFKSFDSEVPSFYFGSMPPFHHLLMNLSCKNASKPLNAMSKKSSQPQLRLRFL